MNPYSYKWTMHNQVGWANIVSCYMVALTLLKAFTFLDTEFLGTHDG